MGNITRYKILTFLLACTALTACIDDDLETCIDDENEIPEIFTDGYALNLKVTLDNMGGTRAVEATGREAELQMLESYIDPEKFRVLFFDREDRFLFESKSRWVKRISESDDNDHSQWFVSVPIYAYGNDEKEDWNWEQIRRVLTGEDVDDVDANGNAIYTDKTKKGDVAFKIAILANRPKREWNMGINGRYRTTNSSGGTASVDFTTDIITKPKYIIENGPNWSTTDTRWGSANAKTIQQNDDKIIRVYDLHHCQYDPIYEGKNWDGYGYQHTQTGGDHGDHPASACYKSERDYDYSDKKVEQIGEHYYTHYGFYDFVSGQIEYEGKMRPTMGATSTWVNWGENDTDDDKIIIGNNDGQTKIRKFMRLSEDHPIPMYGIQAFAPIKDWVKGTPFNLSQIAKGQIPDGEDEEPPYSFKSISLLRSVVKLELVVPVSKKPDFVVLYYPNIYARCEPMDVWTPTDQIWKSDAHDNTDWKRGIECEWKAIKENGPVTKTNANGEGINDPQGSLEEYPKRMAWFYGAWYEYYKLHNGNFWTFNGNTDVTSKLEEKILATGQDINSEDYASPFPHIFNSCIQRNTQGYCDEFYIGKDDKLHYVIYTGERNINDPSDLTNLDETKSGAPTITYWMLQIGGTRYGIPIADSQEYTKNPLFIEYKNSNSSIESGYYYETGNKTGTGNNLSTDYKKLSNRINAYEQLVQKQQAPNAPWPLLRNHVYKITLTETPLSRAGEAGGLSIQSENLYSKNIKFDKPRKETKEKEKVTEKK